MNSAGEHMLDIQEWSYRQAKNRIASHVARGTDKPDSIVKATRTMLAKYDLRREDQERMMTEIYADSVVPFLTAPLGSLWRQPERLERFLRIETLLGT